MTSMTMESFSTRSVGPPSHSLVLPGGARQTTAGLATCHGFARTKWVESRGPFGTMSTTFSSRPRGVSRRRATAYAGPEPTPRLAEANPGQVLGRASLHSIRSSGLRSRSRSMDHPGGIAAKTDGGGAAHASGRPFATGWTAAPLATGMAAAAAPIATTNAAIRHKLTLGSDRRRVICTTQSSAQFKRGRRPTRIANSRWVPAEVRTFAPTVRGG